MTYLETLREGKIKQETVLAIAKGNYFSEITKMEGEWVKMLEDMYGASGMFVSVEFSSWSEALEVSIKKKENDYRPLFKIKFKTDDVSLSGFRDVDLDTDIEDITLYSTESWNVTKITNKCVFAIHVDYTDCVSRRYNKNQFYIDTKDYVKLESVTE